MNSLVSSRMQSRAVRETLAQRSRSIVRTHAVAAGTKVVAPPQPLTWAAVRLANKNKVLEEYMLRPGQVPSTVPTATLPTRPDSHKLSRKPVVLFRDTNAWCPYCERVWLALEEKQIPYDSVLIELYNKPEWYTELVPTKLVPAISTQYGAEVVWESKDILLALEEKFPDAPPLLPTDEQAREEALKLLEEIEASSFQSAGFSYMTGGRRISRDPQQQQQDLPDLEELRGAFLEGLLWFEGEALGRHREGPFLLGEEFSLLDIMCISFMERIGAGLPKFRGFNIRSNPKYPRTAAWYAAMAARPAYQKVRSDDQTLQLLFGRMIGATAPDQVPGGDEEAAAARAEVADALQLHYEAIVDDICAKSGLLRYQCSPYGATARSINGWPPKLSPAVRDGVAKQLSRIIVLLRGGPLGPKGDTSVGSAIGAVTCSFLRLRFEEVTGLLDVSPQGLMALQEACTLGVPRSYADGVDPLPWNPTWLQQLPRPPLSPPPAAVAAAANGNGNGNGTSSSSTMDSEASSSSGSDGPSLDAEAAAEAAWKLELNREAILEDIVRKSGLARPNADAHGATYLAFNGYRPKISPSVIEAVDFQLRRVCLLLLTGKPGPKAPSREAAAVGSAALAFFRNRASAPRDMSAAAAEKLRAACDEALRSTY